MVVNREMVIAWAQWSNIAGEGNYHHGVFQPLGFVDGDNLNQVGIGLQTHLAFAVTLGLTQLGVKCL